MTDSAPDLEMLAVIGMAGRFPKARNLTEFWQNLESGRECIAHFEGDAATVDVGANHGHHVGAGGVLDDLELFDAQFFAFNARDAEGTDPQQRIFLECAWEGLEDAGYVPDHYPGLIGVFAGAALSSYMADIYADPNVYSRFDDMQIGIGNDKDHLTTQLSYKLNLRGPSVTVQTACSTSLVAVCFACQSLLNYDCDIALAGGVAAHLGTEEGYFYQPGGILSPDGHCRPFDASANGTVGGNGVGVVVLKRLSEAVRDGDHIRAVIRGFAMNNDGSRKVGYTAPSVSGQAEVISMAHALAGIEPESITYIETHGTGTSLGDPIEVAALQEVFGKRSSPERTCALGSVKGNIGHLDTAAGVAGLIKAVLSLEHGLIPPSLNFTRLNPAIDLTDSAFYVNAELREWRSEAAPRRAGVSSFGIGGTNAHVVLEEGPGSLPPGETLPGIKPYELLTISARSPAALESATDKLAGHLEAEKPDHLADVAYTLRVGRKAFAHRRALVWPTEDVSGAISALRQRDTQQLLTGKATQRPVHFMFPGQGAQRVGMGAQLYTAEKPYRDELDRCSEALRGRLGLDLRKLLHPPERDEQWADAMLRQTQYAQPALFAVEYALARLLIEWGVEPSGMIGHSIGEYVAACLAGVFPLEVALDLVAVRGELMASMPTGGMLAVPFQESALDHFVRLGLSIAAVNAPSASVLSGANDVLDHVESELRKEGVACARLRVSHAFHSEMMESAARQLVMHMRGLSLQEPQMPYVSNVTGSWVTPELVTEPEYWGQHLRMPVRFADGLASLEGGEASAFFEVGPGGALSALVRQQGHFAQHLALSSLGPPESNEQDSAALVRSLAKLWVAGVEGNATGFYAQEDRRRVPLPTYPFERKRYVVEVPVADASYDEEYEAYDEVDLHDWLYEPVWKPSVPQRTADHPPLHSSERGWLVFHDGGTMGASVTDLLRTRGRVVTVQRGETFARLSAGEYTIDGSRSSEYQQLLDEIERDGGCPDAVVHLWGLSDASALGDGDRHEPSLLLSVNQLAQAMHRTRASREGFVLNIVTNQVHSVTGRERLCPDKAGVLGACRVLPQELPRLTTRAIDVDDDCYQSLQGAAIVEALVAEVISEPSDPVVALRRGYRWVQTFEPAWLGENSSTASRLRQGGTYLITGGLGKVGMVLASYLARTWQANLVLTGRSPLAESDAPVGSAMAQRIETLTALGAQVMYQSADAADADAVARVVDEAEHRFGGIDGVIHAAGLTEGHVMGSEVTDESLADQLRPKAGGLTALARAFEGRQPDFLITMSSLSTVLGGLGLMDYAAANCVMDAICLEHNREGGTPWISVDWDAWDFSPASGLEEEFEASGILPEQGDFLFERIVDRAPGHVIVCIGDLNARFDDWVRLRDDSHPPSETGDGEPFHDRPELMNPYVAAQSTTEVELAEMWQVLLGVAPVGTMDNFFELGGHSLLAIQVISRISERFEVDLSVATVFEMPTIAALAELIDAGVESTSGPSQRAEELLDLVEEMSTSDLEMLLDSAIGPREGGGPDD